jgi:hypothetical protein
LSIAAAPPILMKQPATVPEPVIENTTAELVEITPDAAAPNTGVLRVPE